jgi:hypothetical protein
MTNRLKDIRAVHMLRQYCRSASLMRTAYVGTAQDFQAGTPISELFSPADGKDIAPTWLWLRNWLASLNVLIEGWSRLKLSDPRIDASLSRLKQDGDLKVLKAFRNAVYHFEPDPVDSRFVQLLFVGTASGTVGRLMRLQDQFDSYFDKWATKTDLSGIGKWQTGRK